MFLRKKKMNSSTKKDDETLAKAKKFLFDTHDFDQGGSGKDEPVFSEEQILLAKEKAFEEGREAGLSESRKERDESVAQTLESLFSLLEKLGEGEDKRLVESRRMGVSLALKIVQKIMPQLSKRFSLPEIENLIAETIDRRPDEPRFVVSVAPSILEPLKDRIEAVAGGAERARKVVLMIDETMPETGARVEWADGGAERLDERLLAQVEEELSRAIARFEIAEKTED